MFGSGSGGLILPAVDSSDEGRSRRSVTFSGRAHVQQFDKDESLSSDRHLQQLQQHKWQQQMMFTVPEPPPRKR
jgi:hypothetical protein